jgi:hypothetical protein
MPGAKRKRESSTAAESDVDNSTIPENVRDRGLQPVSGLTLQDDVIEESHQLWLIKAPRNFDLTLLDNVALKMSGNHSKTLSSEDDEKTYVVRNTTGTNESVLQQIVGFVPTGEAGEMTCVPPFTAQVEIVESFLQDQTKKNTTFRGVEHKAYDVVPQLKEMGYRLKCGGYAAVSSEDSSQQLTAQRKKEIKGKAKKKKKKKKKDR